MQNYDHVLWIVLAGVSALGIFAQRWRPRSDQGTPESEKWRKGRDRVESPASTAARRLD